MKEISLSREKNPVSYGALDNAAEDKYHKIKVADLVLEHCIKKGLITSTDISIKTGKYLALKEAIETALHAFQLVDDFDDTNITIDNVDAHIEYKKKLVQRIIRVISDRLLISLPDLRQ